MLSTDVNGKIFYFRGPVFDSQEISPNIPVSSVSLVEILSHSLGVNSYLIEQQSTCYFYQKSTDQVHPAHVFLVDALFGVNPKSLKVIAHAKTGDVLKQVPLLAPAKHREIYDNNYTHTAPANPSRIEGQPPVGIASVDNTYDSSGLAYDMFNARFGRDSWNNNGGTIVVQARYGLDNNAYWNFVDNQIQIGGGSWGFDEAFDVMAHELAHGVAGNEGLTYSGQSATLHESFGDIMAAIFDYDNGGDVWAIGENSSIGAIRYINDPESHDGADYIDELNGQQHHDSGVPSLVFYLATDGGSHPRGESVINVTGLGIDTAADVIYGALLGFYNSSEMLAEAALSQAETAFINFGYQAGCSFASAWHAVGVDSAFWHEGTDNWNLSYMGWIYCDANGTDFFLLEDATWYTYSGYDSTDGAISIFSHDTTSWYLTSAEDFPWYWDYSTSQWDYFSGSYQ